MLATQSSQYKSNRRTMKLVHENYNEHKNHTDMFNSYVDTVRKNQKSYLSYLYNSNLYMNNAWVLTFIDHSLAHNLFAPENHNMLYEVLIKCGALNTTVYDRLLLRGYKFTDWNNLDKYVGYEFACVLHEKLVIPNPKKSKNISSDTLIDYFRVICQRKYTLTSGNVYDLVKLFACVYMLCNDYDEVELQDTRDIIIVLVLSHVDNPCLYEKVCMVYINNAENMIGIPLLNDAIRLISEHPDYVSLETCNKVVHVREKDPDGQSIVENIDELIKVINYKNDIHGIVDEDKIESVSIDDPECNIVNMLMEEKEHLSLCQLKNIENLANMLWNEKNDMENIVHREYIQIYKAVPESKAILNSASTDKLKILENIYTSGIEITPTLVNAVCI